MSYSRIVWWHSVGWWVLRWSGTWELGDQLAGWIWAGSTRYGLAIERLAVGSGLASDKWAGWIWAGSIRYGLAIE